MDQATVKRHIVCLRILPSSGRLGAAERARTSDLLLRRQTLYPLSYGRASDLSLPMRADRDESKRCSNPPGALWGWFLRAASTFAGFAGLGFADAMNDAQTS